MAMTQEELRGNNQRALLASTQESQTIAWAENMFDRASKARQQFERVWYMNLAFYMGRQNVQWAPGVAGNYAKLYEPAAPSWRVRLVSNKIRPITRSELAKVTREKPQAFVIPASTDDDDLAAARAGEAIYEHLWRTLTMNRNIRRAMFWTMLCGSGFMKDWYDPEKPDSSKVAGSILAEPISPFHLYVPDTQEEELENQPHLFHAIAKSPEWVNTVFQKEVPVNASAGSGLLEQRFLSAIGIVNTPKEYVSVKEMWVKPCKKYVDGAVITWTGSTLLSLVEGWPYEHDEFPFTKFDHIPTGRFYADSTIPDLIPLQREYNRCYDGTTEILTSEGWKLGINLLPGEEVLTFDPQTESLKFDSVKEMFIKQYDGPVTVLEGAQISARTTPGHKWFVKSTGGKGKVVTKLTTDHAIPLCAPVDIEGDDDYNFNKIVGLVLSDGRINNGKVLISQSVKVNGFACDEIHDLLSDSLIPYSEYQMPNGIVDFYIRASHSWKIKQVIPNKRLTAEYIMTLGQKGLLGLFDGLMLGDGTYEGNKGAKFYTSLESEADLFQMVCILLGKAAIVRKQVACSTWAKRPYQYIVQVKTEKFSKAGVFGSKKADENYTGLIWCPTVDSGFVMVRRNGKAFISGNTRSQLVESKNRMSKPQLLAPRGSVDPNKITSEPGLIIFYTPGFQPPTPLPMQNIPSYAVQELDRCNQDLADISSQHEVSKGSTPPGVTAATAISYLQEQDDSKLASTVASLEEGVERIGKHFLSHVQQFWTAERKIKVVGDDGQIEAFMFSKANINGNTDLKIEAGSATPRSRAAKQAFITELGKMGWIPPDRALRYLDMAETGRLYEEMQIDARQAQRENLKMMGGLPQAVNSWDVDEVHITEHDNFRKRQAFENSPDAIKMLFETHVQQHKQLIAQAMGAPIAPGETLPTGGVGGPSMPGGPPPPVGGMPPQPPQPPQGV